MVVLNTIAFSNCSQGSSFSSSAVTLRRTPLSSVALSSRRLHNSLRLSALPRYPCILSISSNDIKVNSNIEVDGAPWRVLEFLHVKPGKGAAFVRTKMRNYITGNTVEKTFRAGATIDEADITKELKQFTYKDGEQFVFMDMSTYEESRLNEKDLADKTKWLKEGMECNVLNWKGKTIDVELPITVNYKIIEGDMALRGDREKAGTRPVTIETGAVINVPLFVGAGEEIVVDTRTGTYVTRV